MRYLDLDVARPVSAVGLGTWQFGSREWGYGDVYDRQEAGRIVRRALELGVTLFDTAEVYGRGRSERILYQVHLPNPVVRDDTTMRGMRALRAIGLVDQVGVSNYPLERWRAAEAALGAPVLSNQVQYSLAHLGPEADLVPWATRERRLVIAYSPLAQGLLSGRYDGHRPPAGRVRSLNPLFLPENLHRAAMLLATLREVAQAHDAAPSQVALAWLLRHPCVSVIPGASSLEQLESNVAAVELELRPDEIEALGGAAATFRPLGRAQAAGALVMARFARAGSRP